jgi:HTH-type transcriptional regulator, cell division transcriptional repressor
MTIGDRIRQRRSELSLTQLDIAKALETDSMSVSRWERGVSTPSRPELLVQLADALGVDVRWLITGGDDVAATGTEG